MPITMTGRRAQGWDRGARARAAVLSAAPDAERRVVDRGGRGLRAANLSRQAHGRAAARVSRPATGFDHDRRRVANESLHTLIHVIADALTAHQREVLIALAIDGVPSEELAKRLDTTQGALYKTLHDARCKLKAKFADSC